jgi:hypothetical protein
MATAVLALSEAAPLVIGLLLAAGLVLWLGARRRVVFRIEVADGEVRQVLGEAPDHFVQEVGRLCRFWGIERGWIQGVRRGPRVAVDVGGGMDRRQHAQVFRNAWNYPVR